MSNTANDNLKLSRPVVVLILFELFAASAVITWNLSFPTRNISYVLILVPLVCLEGLYSARIARAQDLHGPDIWRFRAVEVVVIVALIKLVAAFSSSQFVANLIALDARTVLGAVLMLILWQSTLETANDFQEIDSPPEPVMNSSHSEYTSPLARITSRFFVGAILMFVAVGYMTLRTLSAGLVVPAIFAYIVIGLIFLPGLRFQMSRREWQSLGIQTNDAMATPWMRAGLVLVILAAFIAIVLPTAYLLGLLDFLRAVATILWLGVAFIASLLFWLITLPARLLSGQPATQDLPPPPMEKLPDLVNTQTSAPNQLFELLPRIILLALVIYLVVSYLRDHPELLVMIRKLKLLQFFGDLWASLRRGVGTLTEGVRAKLPTLIPTFLRRDSGGRSPLKFIRLKALSERERIFYFYLSALRRAEEQGLPRSPTQTPREYGEALKPSLPDAHEDLDRLTDAFVEARYSDHLVDAPRAKQAQSHWQRIRQALRDARMPKP